MKAIFTNFFLAIATILLIVIVVPYKIVRRLYRRFCIKVLWKRFHIRTSVYRQWHSRRAKKLQEALDNQQSIYPSF